MIFSYRFEIRQVCSKSREHLHSPCRVTITELKNFYDRDKDGRVDDDPSVDPGDSSAEERREAAGCAEGGRVMVV